MTPEELQERERKTKYFSYSVYLITIISGGAITTFDWLYGAKIEFYLEQHTLISTVIAILNGIKLLIDCGMYPIFLHLIHFFYNMKIERLKSLEQDYNATIKNKAFILWVLFLVLLTMLHEILLITQAVGALAIGKDFWMSDFELATYEIARILNSITDTLIALSLVYIYYY